MCKEGKKKRKKKGREGGKKEGKRRNMEERGRVKESTCIRGEGGKGERGSVVERNQERKGRLER